jgi:hypothetical protein
MMQASSFVVRLHANPPSHARPHERNSHPMDAAGREQLFPYAAPRVRAGLRRAKREGKRLLATTQAGAILRELAHHLGDHAVGVSFRWQTD